MTTSCLALLNQSIVEKAEELQDSLFTTAESSSRGLDCKAVQASIMTSDSDPSEAYLSSTNEINIRKESINANEVCVLVLVLQVLTRNFNLVQFVEWELDQDRRQVFQIGRALSPIKPLLQSCTPLPQLINVLLHGRF